MSFNHPCFPEQSIELHISRRNFIRKIAPSRTYGFLRDVEYLWRQGLALGGSLENSVVIGDEGALNDLRFGDELIRHKVLDLIGDLYLLGRPLQGTVVAKGAGHLLHTTLVKEIQRHLESDQVSRCVVTAPESFPLPVGASPKPVGSPAL